MKILIAPTIVHPLQDDAWHLTRQLAGLLSKAGHTVFLSAPRNTGIASVSLIPSPPLSPLPFRSKNVSSYEEWLYVTGVMRQSWLEDDVDSLKTAIRKTKPDLIIEMMRPDALAIAEKYGIRTFSFVHPLMQRKTTFPSRCLQNFNRMLSQEKMVQILSLRDLWQKSSLKFSFGPASLIPFLDDSVVRIGSQCPTMSRPKRTNRICIFLEKGSSFQTSRMIQKAFDGSVYAVNVWYPGCHSRRQNNITWLPFPDESRIPGSIAMIHEGSDYYANLCLSCSILQIGINTHTFFSNWVCRTITRSKAGLQISEEDLNMVSLYSSWRTLLSDDSYDIQARQLHTDTVVAGGLEKLLQYI